MNPWDATGGAGGGSTGVIFYGSSDSIVENVVGEGVYGLNIAGGVDVRRARRAATGTSSSASSR